VASSYTPEDLAWYAENYGGTEWMVHVAGPDEILTHRDELGTEPFTEKDARDTAAAFNRLGEEWAAKSEYHPRVQATVFHFGKPSAEVATDA